MTTALVRQVIDALAEFSSASRLYELSIGDRRHQVQPGALLVEAFLASDGVQEVGYRDVIVLSTSAHLAPDALLGQPATFAISLADGTREHFSGEINEVAMLGSDGGLSRYRIRISPWLWRLEQVRNCRVWQDKGVIEIVDAVLSAYQPAARWRWSDDVGPFMADVPPRSYCCQYRESDRDFLCRMLAEEGLGWRVEQLEDGVGLVLFGDSSQLSAVPEDASSAALGGIRFHGARSVEESDSIQAMTAQRRLHASLTTVLSSDYKAKRVIGASSPSHFRTDKLPELESFDVPGQYAFSDWSQAQRYADLHMQGIEARGQLWQGRSTVRTMRAGTRMRIIGAPLQQLSESAPFTALKVLSVGVNNMPPLVQHALTELFGPIPELLEEAMPVSAFEGLTLAVEQARETGYANCFEALATHLIWRPQFDTSADGSQRKPVAFGAQSAIVVGAEGNDSPNGANEVYCDRLGRIRIRFHWQDSGGAICWVRVAQRSAGAEIGQQFLPRIGQEVLVQFLENDIDRPLLVGALYNGQGAGGVVRTPGGRRETENNAACFEAAQDHASSAQDNLSRGDSPVWHGASADQTGHRNPGAQWGIRSKEYGAYGYSQLLFDDRDRQSRVQLKSTYSGSELDLGHLVHAADNYLGSLRGIGAELRTDAYGATRAGAGLLVSSYQSRYAGEARESFSGNTTGVALIKQAVTIAEAFSSVAGTYQTVALAAHLGPTKANASKIDNTSAPLQAMSATLSRACNSTEPEAKAMATSRTDAMSGAEATSQQSHSLIAISAQGSFSANAGRSINLVNQETTVLVSNQNTQFFAGEQMRLQSRQAIGFLGVAANSGKSDVGLQLITSKDPINIQAQQDLLNLAAKTEIDIISANAKIDFAAAKTVTLVTAGGASIVINAGNISLNCPGKISIMAGKKSFSGQSKSEFGMPELPRGTMQFDEKFQLLDSAGEPIANMRFSIAKSDGGEIVGTTDQNGMLPLQQGFSSERLFITILGKVQNG